MPVIKYTSELHEDKTRQVRTVVFNAKTVLFLCITTWLFRTVSLRRRSSSLIHLPGLVDFTAFARFAGTTRQKTVECKISNATFRLAPLKLTSTERFGFLYLLLFKSRTTLRTFKLNGRSYRQSRAVTIWRPWQLKKYWSPICLLSNNVVVIVLPWRF